MYWTIQDMWKREGQIILTTLLNFILFYFQWTDDGAGNGGAVDPRRAGCGGWSAENTQDDPQSHGKQLQVREQAGLLDSVCQSFLVGGVVGGKCWQSPWDPPMRGRDVSNNTNFLGEGNQQTAWFLAHLVMSLCNNALSIMFHCCCCCQHWHLCSALPVTGLIIEALYLINICSYVPSICTWNIKSMWHIFFKRWPF